jgi:diaminopimelate decarboxylase
MIPDPQLLEAAQTYGTPLYAYDLATLERQLHKVNQTFGTAQKFYALKANPNLHLLRHIVGAGFGLECVSLGELERARHVGCAGERILVNGPAKSPAEYQLGAELGATFVVDRESELELLPPRSRCLLRVNPALEVSTHPHLATGAGHSKFGIPLERIAPTLHTARAMGLEVRGLHLHIGSAIRDAHDFAVAFEKIAQLARSTGPLEVLDCGGGWGLDADLGGIAQVAFAAANTFDAQLWLEPGRFLVAECGVLLASVVGFKQTQQNFVLLDAGMTELLRPMLYGAVHQARVLGKSDLSGARVTLAGPACESGDLLGQDLNLPALELGDVVALEQVGAYGAAMSSNYLTRGRPMEVLLEGGAWRVIRQRETAADIWRLEL